MLFKILSICKGGGYRYCRTDPPHPKRNSMGLYPLHRVLMENKLGRLLTNNESVHHSDENKSNDELNNLVLETKESHSRHHALKRAPKALLINCSCGKNIIIKPHEYRLRSKRNKTGKIYCSRSCGSIFPRYAEMEKE